MSFQLANVDIIHPRFRLDFDSLAHKIGRKGCFSAQYCLELGFAPGLVSGEAKGRLDIGLALDLY